jgi:hypothetical protein
VTREERLLATIRHLQKLGSANVRRAPTLRIRERRVACAARGRAYLHAVETMRRAL